MHHGIGGSNTTKKESRQYKKDFEKLKTQKARLKYFAEGDVDAIYLTNFNDKRKSGWWPMINFTRFAGRGVKFTSFKTYEEALIAAIKEKKRFQQKYKKELAKKKK